MSKPQVASEPTLEEILSSIRKMISDDRPGPSPLPDQMGRTPFGEPISRGPSPSDTGTRGASESGPARTDAVASNGFNSLSDALKVATTLSDQRRSLQQEVASALEKTPRSNLDALTELSAGRTDTARFVAEGRAEATEVNGLKLPGSSDRFGETSTPAGEGKRDLLSFDFGTMVPQRDDAQGKSQQDATRPATSTPLGQTAASPSPSTIEVPAAKAEPKVEQPAESRVLQLRSGLNGSTTSGLNGAAPNVAPFPRALRDTAKAADAEAPAAKAPEAPGKTVTPEPETTSAQPLKEAPATKSDALTLHGEALLDAVVDLVQQQPSAMSVFSSGASFIGGVAGLAKAASEAKAREDTPAASASVPHESAGGPEVPQQKIDRDAAELLRPMLRQWLTENMGRILEEALRSELSDQTGKGPAKS